MAEFDLIIRNGKVVTASDVMQCDVGIKDGRIVALATELSGAVQEIDAADQLILPGGVDAHCHLG